MYQLRRLLTPLACLSLFALAVWPAAAQTWIGGVGSYNDPANWEDGLIPDFFFDEIATINNGGTAFVIDTPGPPAGVVLGESGADSGTLEVRSGGVLEVVPAESTNQGGDFVVGQSGTGHLTVLRGGSLTAEALSSGGNVASSIVLGQIGGTGTADVTINGQANLARNTRVVGPNVNFTSQTLTLSGTLIPEITGINHSTLMVSSSANIGGSLLVEFNGHTPVSGDAWNLVDAARINGAFGSIASNVSLGPGQVFIAAPVPGGTNGALLQLRIEQVLSLSVNRETGAVTMNNVPGGEAVELDGYSIRTASGSLDPAFWFSLQEQGVGGFLEGNPSNVHLSELDPLGSSSFVGGTTFELGNVYRPNPSQFGEETEDLVFDHTRPSDGAIIQDQVEYSGFGINNLVLRIDPGTGEGFLVNESTFTVDIDGYTITSDSGALLPDGWNSLEEQGIGDWRASNNSDSNRLSELDPLSATTLETGTTFDLGPLFDSAGVRDLALEFVFPGESEARQGAVEYVLAPPPSGFDADFDDDGDVDGDDFLLWQTGFPTPSGATKMDGDADNDGDVDGDDFLVWQTEFPSPGSGAGSGAVPEPSTFCLLSSVLGMAFLWGLRRGRAGRG